MHHFMNAVVQKVCIEKKSILHCIFTDLKYVFDSINFTSLWYKLFEAGVNRKMVRKILDIMKQGEVMPPLYYLQCS